MWRAKWEWDGCGRISKLFKHFWLNMKQGKKSKGHERALVHGLCSTDLSSRCNRRKYNGGLTLEVQKSKCKLNDDSGSDIMWCLSACSNVFLRWIALACVKKMGLSHHEPFRRRWWNVEKKKICESYTRRGSFSCQRLSADCRIVIYIGIFFFLNVFSRTHSTWWVDNDSNQPHFDRVLCRLVRKLSPGVLLLTMLYD